MAAQQHAPAVKPGAQIARQRQRQDQPPDAASGRPLHGEPLLEPNRSVRVPLAQSRVRVADPVRRRHRRDWRNRPHRARIPEPRQRQPHPAATGANCHTTCRERQGKTLRRVARAQPGDPVARLTAAQCCRHRTPCARAAGSPTLAASLPPGARRGRQAPATGCAPTNTTSDAIASTASRPDVTVTATNLSACLLANPG